MSRNAFFSSRPDKNNFFNIDIVINNKSEMWFVLLSTMSMCHYSFPKLFSYCFCMLSEFAKVFERKVWDKRVSHLHNAIISSPSWCFQLSTNLDKDFFHYPWYCGKKQIKCDLVWSVLLSTMIRVITVVKICCGLASHNTSTTVMMCMNLSIRVQTTLNKIWFVKLTKSNQLTL